MDSDIVTHQSIAIETPAPNEKASLLLEEIHASEARYRGEVLSLSGTIHKVPSFLHEGNIDIRRITPKHVSIGPYHHGTLHLQEMEGVKLKYLGDLINRSPLNRLEKYIQTVEQLASRAKAEYSGLGELDHDYFVKMMVVDGCFIVELFLKSFLDRRVSRVTQVSTVMNKLAVLRNDLLLVENQIPLFILEELFKATATVFEEDVIFLRGKIVGLALMFYLGCKPDAEVRLLEGNVEFDHLLHLFHTTLKLSPYTFSASPFTLFGRVSRYLPTWKSTNELSASINYFNRILCWNSFSLPVPNACSLRDIGFTFQKGYDKDHFMYIFRKGREIMIPVLCVDESMLAKFENLVAFESCSNKHGHDFTAYAIFLNYLIDSAEDAALLKECGVIDNRLGDDQKVADFFNKLCRGINIELQDNYLSPLFDYLSLYHIEHRYMVKFYQWRKKYIPDYFKNPWAIPSMIAALVLLALSILQTIFTIYPYYHPRSNS